MSRSLLTGNVKQNSVNVNGTLAGNSYMQWDDPAAPALAQTALFYWYKKGELGVKELNL